MVTKRHILITLMALTFLVWPIPLVIWQMCKEVYDAHGK